MKLRKIICTAVAAAMCLCMTACGSSPEVVGDDLINRAREDYANLNSAKVVMTNIDTGEVDQTFTFKYDEKDVLTYSYEGKSEESEYAEYNNGSECFSYSNGKYTYISKGDRDFIKYLRKTTHPQADKGMIAFVPTAVTSAKMEENDGITKVSYIYDVDKIGAEVESGKATGFEADYFFDEDRNLMYFTEITTGEDNGEKTRYAYKIEITEKNSVDKVENTAIKYKPADEAAK